MMEHYTTNPNVEEINAGIAGIVSFFSNILLIFVTSRVKSYSEPVRWAQYYSCAFRLVFSLFVVITSPTIMYITEVKALYIVKGGIDIDRNIGAHILNLFVVFVVTSCTGPTVQYLQVAYLLANPALKNHMILRSLISSIPLVVAIPTYILIYIGYTPSKYEMNISESLIQEITNHPDSSFLIAPEEKIFDETTQTFSYDVWARICTFFIFTVMIISLIVVIISFSHIQKTMRKKSMSTSSKKSQRQLNLLLMVQFIFPFLTIHIPFYTAFILPYLDLEFTTLSSNLPFLFAWCPAINPILVICMVKMTHISSTTSPDSNLQNTNVDEINSDFAGLVSLIGNLALIYATSKVKVYSSSFRKSQYYVCILRLLFSMVVVLTSPTLVYVAKMKSLYIVKGGFFLPFYVGLIFLILFIFFVVISCSSPTIQYLQLCHLLSDRGHSHDRFGPIISTISVLTGLPALALVAAGYTPTEEEISEAKDIVYHLNGEGDSAFLMVTVTKRKDATTGEFKMDWTSEICTFYILTIMLLSVITVIICSFYIRKQMKKKLMSASAKKSQNQIILILALQFTLPFITVYVPFIVSFILPMFDIENTFLSTNLPYLFSWCPAINPILVLVLVKNVRDRLLCRTATSKTSSSNMIQVRQSQVLSARAQ